MGREKKGSLWVPHPTIPLTSSSYVGRHWSYNWFRLSFLGPCLSLGLLFQPVVKYGRACVCRDGSTHPLPAMHSSPLALLTHGADGTLGSAKGSVSVLRAAWGWFAGAAVGLLHRPRVDWIGESRNLRQSLWLNFVPMHCLSKDFWLESRQVFKTCSTIYKNDAEYSVFTSISQSREIQKGGKWGIRNRINAFYMPPSPHPIQDQHSPRGSRTITFTVWYPLAADDGVYVLIFPVQS